jgi:hypothetical protein
MISAGRKLAVTTWNIAAINNNPFEYWITYKANPEYEKLMINIEKFLEDPGEKDVAVKEVFTEDMFTKLDKRLTGVGWTSVRSYWESDFQNRKIVSGFMKVSFWLGCVMILCCRGGVMGTALESATAQEVVSISLPNTVPFHKNPGPTAGQ